MSNPQDQHETVAPHPPPMSSETVDLPEHPPPRAASPTCQPPENPTAAPASRADTEKQIEEDQKESPPDESKSKPDPTEDQPELPENGQNEQKVSGAKQAVTNENFSEWSHQRLAIQPADTNKPEKNGDDEGEWQTMPSYAPYDIYDDDGRLVAKEHAEEMCEAPPGYSNALEGMTNKGYTRVVVDDDAQSATSMDDNTAYLFPKSPTNALDAEDEETRNVLAQMQATKQLLTDNQRIAYVGIVRLASAEMCKKAATVERTKGTRKAVDFATASIKMWAQKMMVRLYGHMELEAAEQIMIEQLAEHGLQADDLAPALMKSSHVKNPMSKTKSKDGPDQTESDKIQQSEDVEQSHSEKEIHDGPEPSSPTLPAYSEVPDAAEEESSVPPVQDQSEVLDKEELDIDLRWTVLCDLFLILISDSTYDARSRVLLEKVAAFLDVSWVDVCRFERRVTEALEMEEEAQKEDWNEADHIAARSKQARRRRLAMMGLATVGGGLVIGLSAGLLAPVIGAGLAAGFTTFGVTGTSAFLTGAGGVAMIGSAGTLVGGRMGVRAAHRRTGAVKTFEYRPLHNNKRVNLIVTVAGWINGKVDDVRLPYSTVDPVMGDIYSVLWEPDMLRSTGDTMNILATEALTQGLQQILGMTILTALMSAIQLPILLSKLSYLVDNPWSVSVARADAAGLILADSLVDRNLGARPITLVGFSLGSRVIFAALRELAKKGAVGVVQNVYLFGTPVVIRKDEYLSARAIVSGRFVNGYATNDWILGGGIMPVAGLRTVDVPDIENVDVTELVHGHMQYRPAMPRLLRKVGWTVTDLDFTEIEDPDPDNHEKRQRELINEIEDARNELQKQPEKRRFGIFKRNKKRAQKKDWETYEESPREGGADQGGDPLGPLFDIEAIRKATVELAAEGMDVTELPTTLPPMRIETPSFASSSVVAASASTTPKAESSQPRASTTESYASTSARQSTEASYSSRDEEAHSNTANGYAKVGYTNDSYFPRHGRNESDDLYYENDDITMTFEPSSSRPPSLPPKPIAGPSRSPSPKIYSAWQPDNRAGSNGGFYTNHWQSNTNGSARSLTLEQPQGSRSPDRFEDALSRSATPVPVANGSKTASSNGVQAPPPINPGHNVWADEEEDGFGHEKEVSMTFE